MVSLGPMCEANLHRVFFDGLADLNRHTKEIQILNLDDSYYDDGVDNEVIES